MNQPAGQFDAQPKSAGDIAAAQVAAALSQHDRWLRTVLAARGVERTCLDEVMQEVAMQAIGGASRLRDPQRAAAWLYRLAVVAALQHRRRVGRRRKLVERFAASGAAPDEALEVDPLAWLLADEQQQLVRQAIGSLHAQDAEILLLKYTEDWSYRQLADRLGLSASAVEARLHRARGRMRTALARLAPDLVADG